MSERDLPAEILSAIDADVERYRNMRIQVALRKNTPEYLEKLARRAEFALMRKQDTINRIVQWFVDGQSIDEIVTRFRFIKRNRIKSEIEYWIHNRLYETDRARYDKWELPRFSEAAWRSFIATLDPASSASSQTNSHPSA